MSSQDVRMFLDVLFSPVCLVLKGSVCLLFTWGSFGSHVISDTSAFYSHGSAPAEGWSSLALARGVLFLMCCTIFWLWTHALWNFIWEFFEAWMEVTFFQRGCVFTFTRSLETLQTQIHFKLNVQPWLWGSHSQYAFGSSFLQIFFSFLFAAKDFLYALITSRVDQGFKDAYWCDELAGETSLVVYFVF